MPIIATGAVAALSGIATSVAGISDTKKRREFEQGLASLDLQQKKALNDQLLKASSEQARQQLLAEAVSKASLSRIDAIARAKSEQDKTKRTTIVVVGIVVGLVLIGATIIYIKNRK